MKLLRQTQDDAAALRGLLLPPDLLPPDRNATLACGDADRVFRLESADG